VFGLKVLFFEPALVERFGTNFVAAVHVFTSFGAKGSGRTGILEIYERGWDLMAW
jgi:hypothetical protein